MGNVITCFLPCFGYCFIAILVHSPKTVLKRDKTRDEGDIVAVSVLK